MAKISLFLDEDVHLELGKAFRNRGFDAIHAQESGRKGYSDASQLEYAVEQKRCLVSFNVKDFVQLHNECAKREIEHYGIVASKQQPIRIILRKLLNHLQKNSRESFKNRIEFI